MINNSCIIIRNTRLFIYYWYEFMRKGCITVIYMLSRFLFSGGIYQKKFFISRWVPVNNVNEHIFWFLVSYFKTKSFSIMIINTKIMPYTTDQILVNKNCVTTACFANFPNLRNAYTIWKLIHIVETYLVKPWR